jgi:hypothetical protein
MVHPGLYAVIVGLLVVIAAGAVWVFYSRTPSTLEPITSVTPSSVFTWGNISLNAPNGWVIMPTTYRTPAQQEANEKGEVIGFGVIKTGAYNDVTGAFSINAGGPQSDSTTCADVPGRTCARYVGTDGLRFPLWTTDDSTETTDVFRDIANQLKKTGSLSFSAAYENLLYGLRVQLPSSWIGFTVDIRTWNATGVVNSANVGSGPEIHIVHPLSTTARPRQDIPVMVFTFAEWDKVKGSNDVAWTVSAAPFPPSELARSAGYVFALPPRAFGYATPEGWEEVERLVREGAVRAF